MRTTVFSHHHQSSSVIRTSPKRFCQWPLKTEVPLKSGGALFCGFYDAYSIHIKNKLGYFLGQMHTLLPTECMNKIKVGSCRPDAL